MRRGLTVVVLFCGALSMDVAAWAKEQPGVMTVTSKSPAAVAAFKKARDLLENQRRADAIEELKKAVKLDPEFALALGQLAVLTPGPEGDAALDKAAGLASKLPDAERLQIEIWSAGRKGDGAHALELNGKLAEAAPNDAHVHIAQATIAMNRGNYDEASASAQKAVKLDPKAAVAYNTLAYSLANQNKWDEAIAAAKKQAQLLPREPNPQDSLGEILLWAGRFPEAEAAFQRALKMDPSFANAWQGVALARLYRGDWKGGIDALAKGKQASKLPDDKYAADVDLAWVKLAQGNLQEGLAVITAAENDVKQLPEYAFAAVDRAWLDHAAEKYADAIAEDATALDRAEKGQFSPGAKAAIRRGALVNRALSEVKLGKTADAEKTLAMLDDELKKLPPGTDIANEASWARGSLAAAKGDAKTADQQFEVCFARNIPPCLFDRARMLEKAGDKAGAEKARSAAQVRYYRNAGYVFLKNRLSPPK